MKKVWKWFTSHYKVVVLSVCIATTGLWTVDRRLPVTQIENTAIPFQVKAGKKLWMRHTVFRSMSCPSLRDRVMLDGGKTRTYFGQDSWTAAPGPLGIADTYFDNVLIPTDAKPGPAHLTYNIAWTCNPIQAVLNMPVTTQVIVNFEIVK